MGDWILNKVRKCFTPYLIYINRSGSATGTGEPLVTCVAKTHRVASRDECKIIKVVFEYRLHFNTSFPPMLSTQDILVIHACLPLQNGTRSFHVLFVKHSITAAPWRSKPLSQRYLTLLPTEKSLPSFSPLVGTSGFLHFFDAKKNNPVKEASLITGQLMPWGSELCVPRYEYQTEISGDKLKQRNLKTQQANISYYKRRHESKSCMTPS